MTDLATIEEYTRAANPIPTLDAVDADELASAIAATHMRRAAAMQAPSQHPSETAAPPTAPPPRWRSVLAFAAAFIVILVVVGAAALMLSDGSAPTTGAVTEAPTTPARVVPGPPEVTEGLAYTDDRKLDVYAPTGAGPWPIVVVVHGLGQGGQLSMLAEAIAEEGAVVYNITSNMVPPFDAALEEVECAVRFARGTAGDYGGDSERVTLVGYSAGAATGMVVALTGGGSSERCVVTDESAHIDALVGFEGAYDWTTRKGAVMETEEDPRVREAVDPYVYIGGNPSLVVRLVHGDIEDDMGNVPLVASADFHHALSEAGYDTDLTVVAGVAHADLKSGPYAPVPDGFDATVQHAINLARG